MIIKISNIICHVIFVKQASIVGVAYGSMAGVQLNQICLFLGFCFRNVGSSLRRSGVILLLGRRQEWQ